MSGTIISERATVHVTDDTGRVAMLELRNTDPAYDSGDDPQDVLIRYIYSNHLQSSTLELDETGAVICYEEYHPYGTTAYQGRNAGIHATAKRYRFTGKERDDESGFNYHGARYYAPWLCRWTAVDPLESKYAPLSSYNYGFNNPITWIDPTRMGGENKSKPITSDTPPGAGEPMKINTTGNVFKNDLAQIITISSTLNLYGEKASQDLADRSAREIENTWNDAHGITTIKGIEYKVRFQVSGKYLEDNGDLKKTIENNKDYSQLYFRISENIGYSYTNKRSQNISGGNTGEYKLSEINSGVLTTAHEYGHTLGLPHLTNAFMLTPEKMLTTTSDYKGRLSYQL